MLQSILFENLFAWAADTRLLSIDSIALNSSTVMWILHEKWKKLLFLWAEAKAEGGLWKQQQKGRSFPRLHPLQLIKFDFIGEIEGKSRKIR